MKINKEGYKIITTAAIIAVLIICIALFCACKYAMPQWIVYVIAVLMLFKVAFVAMFFREPARPYIQQDGVVYAPADGKIVVVEEVEENEFLGEKRIQVSVFMSITNVHVNWYPVSGIVTYFKYHPGRFMVAWHPKSSEDNERTTTVVDTGKHKILFRQIAGFVARRIVSYAKVGEPVKQNTKCGFIKFGSRIDLMLPVDSEILVSIGEKVVGSQTPIAKLK